MGKILTIAVPTYNVERYLRESLDSYLIPEIMDDIEVLVINDGSKDSSPQIAAEYVQKYPNTFRLINKENGGHGSGINRGIIEAAGTYFKVIDSDDWVAADAMTALVHTLAGTKSDLVYSNFYWVDDQTRETKVEFAEPFAGVEYHKEYQFDEIGADMFLKMHGYTVRTELLRKIPQIDEHCFYVDMEYVLFPIPYVKTITFIPDYVYMYRVGLPTQSMSPERMQKNEDNYDRVLQRLFSYYDGCRDNGISKRKQQYMEHVLGRMVATRIKIFLSFPYDKQIQTSIREFDCNIKKNYPKVYAAVINRAVKILRKTGYHTYALAKAAYSLAERK